MLIKKSFPIKVFFSVYHIPIRFSIEKDEELPFPVLCLRRFIWIGFLLNLTIHHNLRDNIQHLLMATATARGAIGDSLYVTESRQNAFKILVSIQCVCDIRIAYLFAITYHIIFYHNITSDYFYHYHLRVIATIPSTAPQISFRL